MEQLTVFPALLLINLPPLQPDFEAVVGIECHVQLNTTTKAFCNCTNEFGAEPNTHICPVCLGHPVSLSSPLFLSSILETLSTINIHGITYFLGCLAGIK